MKYDFNKLNAISFDDELPDTLDVTLHRISNQDAEKHEEDIFFDLLFDEDGNVNMQVVEQHKPLIEIMNNNPTYVVNKVRVSTLEDLKNLLHKTHKVFGDEGTYNWIDITGVQSFSALFRFSDNSFLNFNGHVELWNTSEVKNMNFAFMGLYKFNRDLSNWDLQNVEWCSGCFTGCNDEFKTRMKDKIRTECKKIKALFDGIV